MPATRARSAAKTVTYRILGALVTAVVAWGATGNVQTGLAVGLVDAGIKVFIYYVHERAWNATDWGRGDEPETALEEAIRECPIVALTDLGSI